MIKSTSSLPVNGGHRPRPGSGRVLAPLAVSWLTYIKGATSRVEPVRGRRTTQSRQAQHGPSTHANRCSGPSAAATGRTPTHTQTHSDVSVLLALTLAPRGRPCTRGVTKRKGALESLNGWSASACQIRCSSTSFCATSNAACVCVCVCVRECGRGQDDDDACTARGARHSPTHRRRGC
jgi:hypothetical protein